MHGILDKEMPVAPVRQLWWKWLLLLLFLGIMAGGTYYNFAIKNTTQPHVISDTNIAHVIENTNETDKFEENNETTFPRTDDFSRRKEINDLTAKVVSTNAPKITPKKEVEKNIVQNNLYIRKENNFTDKKINTTQAPRTDDFSHRKQINNLTAKVVSTDISEKEQTSKIETPIVAPIKNSTKNPVINTEYIARLSPQITRNNSAILQPSPDFDPIPKIRKKVHRYSVFAGVHSDEFSGFGGINVGFLAHYKLAPKLGLETGLSYNNFRKKINTYRDYTAEVDAEIPNNTKQFSRTLNDALSLHYLRLPILFTHRPHKKIQLAAGLNMGRRFTIPTANTSDLYIENDPSNNNIDTFNSSDGGFNSSFTVDLQNPDAIEISSPDYYLQINVPYSFSILKWDLAAQAGLRYYPIPRLGIDLNYQYGLTNMTRNSTRNRNSGIRLALVWQLHR